MVDENATHRRRVKTAKEHLAGVHAGQIWAQEVVANHLEHLSSVYDQATSQPPTPTEPQEAAP